MTGLIRAEVLKLRTTRTFWAITLGALALVAIAAAAISAASRFTPGDHPAQQALAVAGPANTFALVLGVLAVTSEYRHGTITPALLITPRRTRLLVAKLITLTVGGLVLGCSRSEQPPPSSCPSCPSATSPASWMAAPSPRSSPAERSPPRCPPRWASASAPSCATRQAPSSPRSACSTSSIHCSASCRASIASCRDSASAAWPAAQTAWPASARCSPPRAGPAALILAAYALAVLTAGAVTFRRRDLPA